MTRVAGPPRLDDAVYLTDGGMETTLIYHEGFELPHFAAFTLLASDEGRAAVEDYYTRYLELAERHGLGIVLDAATWRASPDWGAACGYSRPEVAEANREGVALVDALRAGRPSKGPHVVVSGAVGPRGDGYAVSEAMSVEEARRYHSFQLEALADAGADMVTALTLTYAEEAAGIALAAADCGLPVAISFTVETGGRLPSGQSLADAVAQVDEATEGAPLYFMVNCAHPTHLGHLFDHPEDVLARVRGLRANASSKSHAELDEATELDEGDPDALGAEVAELRRRFPALSLLGGCCGTDERHIDAIATAVGRASPPGR